MLYHVAALAVLLLTIFGALRLGHRSPGRQTLDPRARVEWSAYLNEPPNPCDTGHTRLYLTGPPPESSGVICAVCTTPLSRPAWMDCPDCDWFPVEGRLHVTRCGVHAPEREAA
ncbi:MAG: hypothetical protein ACR2LI_07965 [Propionibacteriaceae bacterium]